MEVFSSKKPASADVSVSKLQLYRSPPTLEVRLEDFERFAIERLIVLRKISDGLARGKKLDEIEKLEKWNANMKHPQSSEEINKDIISHFVLRLVYCRREELRKWFLQMESVLFRYRFQRETSDVHKALMTELGIPYEVVNSADLMRLKDNLSQVARSINQPAPTSDVMLYKVPFEEVPELVASRRVLIRKGFAYVALVVSFVIPHFRSHLSKAPILTNRKWASMIREQEKDRLTPIVEALSTSYLGPDYTQGKEFGEISLKDIDQVARTSFPLCMQHLFKSSREDHHLKHGGRMQLGLFLKGVGLKLDDALAFWKAEFSQKVGSERFDKEYAYSIRHNYGKEGKRTELETIMVALIVILGPFDPFGPIKIKTLIGTFVSQNEENLRAALGKLGVSGKALDDVIGKAKSRDYQLACTLTFEALHRTSLDVGINHPNQYFSESQKYLEEKKPPSA